MSPLLEALAGDSARGYGLGLPSGAASSFESIATTTLSGSSSTITFSSIPSTYKHLQIRGLILAASGYTVANFNSDTATNYSRHYLGGNGSTTAAAGTANTANPIIAGNYAFVGTYPNVFICDILDYADTTKYKTVRSMAGADNNSTGGWIELDSTSWRSTSAINRIDLTGATYLTGSTFALYGIKG